MKLSTKEKIGVALSAATGVTMGLSISLMNYAMARSLAGTNTKLAVVLYSVGSIGSTLVVGDCASRIAGKIGDWVYKDCEENKELIST